MNIKRRWKVFKHNFFQFLVAIDQLINTILGLFMNSYTWADETMSANCHKHALRGITWPEKVVNAIMFFEKDHCRIAYESEKLRLHSPVEERTTQLENE